MNSTFYKLRNKVFSNYLLCIQAKSFMECSKTGIIEQKR